MEFFEGIFKNDGTLNSMWIKDEGAYIKNNFNNYYKEICDYISDNVPFLQKIYHWHNKISEIPKCPICGKPRKFKRFKDGYFDTCSKECGYAKRKLKQVKEYNLFNSSGTLNSNLIADNGKLLKDKLPELYDKIITYDSVHHLNCSDLNQMIFNWHNRISSIPLCPTCGKEVSYNGFNKGYSKYCSKACISRNDSVKDKKKNNSITKFGTEYVFQSDEVKKKIKKTLNERYGVDSYSKTDMFKEKVKKSLKKYGESVEGCISIPSVKEKYIKTLRKNNYDNFEKRLKEDKCLELLTSEENYIETNEYEVKCLKCGKKYKTNGTSFKEVLCCSCYVSKFEHEVHEFLEKELNIKDYEYNNRKIIYPKELDIFLPSYNIAIECDGIFFHTEESGKKDKSYHLNKTKECLSKGIRLIHIFENEWKFKKDIVKSLLTKILNKCEKKIYARQCKIENITAKECRIFLNENHLQGFRAGKFYIGLKYKDELVSVAVLGNIKNNEIELIRFANKNNLNVYYSLGRILKNFMNEHSFDRIISFCDKRYFIAGGYESAGFKKLYDSDPNYFYVHKDDYLKLMNRIQFQKFKLKNKLQIFDVSLSEWENMKLNGFDRIWDCGNIKLEYT